MAAKPPKSNYSNFLVQFHHEYPWILSGSDDQTIRIWNMQSRACMGVLAGHSHYVMCARFHPSEDLVVSASLDQTVRVWDTSGLRKRTVRGSHADDMLVSGGRRLGGGGGGGGMPGGVGAGMSGGGGPGGAELFASDAVAKYVLEGHDRGVNWACFHPRGPYIASGADDRTVKVWQFSSERAWEAHTLRGHSNNVSCCVFHPTHDLVLSNGEDRSIRVWDYKRRLCLSTFRRDRERFWILAAHPSKNLLAAGHDQGLLVFKLERERPAYGPAASDGVFYFTRDRSLRRAVLGAGDAGDVAVAHVRRGASAFDFGSRPRSLVANGFNEREEQVLVLSSAEGGLYELYLPGAGDAGGGAAQRGAGLSACFLSRSQFVVLDRTHQIAVKNMDNVTTKRVAPPFPEANAVFPSSTAGRILVRADDRLALFETASRRVLGQVSGAKVRYVVWSPDGNLVALLSRTQVSVCDRNLHVLATYADPVRVKGGAWDAASGAFVYATHTHLRYLLPVQISSSSGASSSSPSPSPSPSAKLAGASSESASVGRWRAEVGVLRTLDDVVYPLSAGDGVCHCLDRSGRIVALSYDPTEYHFKRALAAGEFARVIQLIRHGNMCGQALIAYLRRAGFPEVAMHFVEDADTKLALALECGDLDAAAAAARVVAKPEAWRRVADAALAQGATDVVEAALQQVRDMTRLTMLYLALGRRGHVSKMAEIAARRGDGPGQFHAALFTGDAAARVAVLERAGQLALAFAAASTYGLTEDAERIRGLLDEAGIPVPDLEAVAAARAEAGGRVGSTACLPPKALVQGEAWPQLAVRRSAFDTTVLTAATDAEALAGIHLPGSTSSSAGGAAASKDPFAAAAAAAAGDGVVDDDAWGGGLADAEPDSGLGPGKAQAISGEVDEAAWGGDDLDLDLDLDASKGGGAGGAGGASSTAASKAGGAFVAPTRGLGWRLRATRESSVAGEHAAAGNVEEAMRLLNRQLGIVSFDALLPHLEAAASASTASLPTLPSLPPLAPPVFAPNVSPPRPSSLVTLASLEDRLRGMFAAFTAGKFGDVESAANDLFAALPLCVARSRAEANTGRKYLDAAREYKTFVVAERTRRALGPDQADRALALACYNTHCDLAPPHALLALRLAMTVAFKAKNFITAASFARRVLESPEAAAPANAKLTTMARQVLAKAQSEGRNEVDIDYDPKNPFRICAATLTPIYRGSPLVTAPYSGAAYNPQFRGKICLIDRMSLIGEETLGLVLQASRPTPPSRAAAASATTSADAPPADEFDEAW